MRPILAAMVVLASTAAFAQDGQNRPAPEPDLAMGIENIRADKATAGAPLVFCLRLANESAANARSTNRARLATTRATTRAVAEKRMHPQLARRFTDVPVVLEPVDVIRLPEKWRRHVLIQGRRNGADWQTLAATPIPTRQEPPRDLDGQDIVETLFALPPDAAATRAPGAWEFRAVLEVTAGDGWRGRAESSAVKLSIEKRSDQPGNAEKLAAALTSGAYYQALGDFHEAVRIGQEALRANADSMDAHLLVGDAYRETGQKDEALAAYSKAAAAFHKTNPNARTTPHTITARLLPLLADEGK